MWSISEGERGPEVMGCLVFNGLGNLKCQGVGELFQIFWGRGGDFQELGHHPPFDPYGQPWNCHGACGCVISLADVLQ